MFAPSSAAVKQRMILMWGTTIPIAAAEGFFMIQKLLERNKRKYIAYNAFRKKMFFEQYSEGSEVILYLLPWLLSINESRCPGYVPNCQKPFRVYDIDYSKTIRRLEKEFKKRFNIEKQGTLLRGPSYYHQIQGIYTIGSVGSVAQGKSSDCDIWICIDKRDFDNRAWSDLSKKINLIKDWMDIYLKIPVFFFICDITDVKNCRFGDLDDESCGSTQQNVLKEEFYRTGMLICGRTPLWWLCHDPANKYSYDEIKNAIKGDGFWEYDLVDFGDLEKVDGSEYFGAALWQLHKSLSNPIKSILKINLLRILLEAPQARLLCHVFREQVMSCENINGFPDFSIFTTSALLEHYRKTDKMTMRFLSECYYLQAEINPYDRRRKMKNTLAAAFLKAYPIPRKRQTFLRHSSMWDFREQIEHGHTLFGHLIRMYRELSASHNGSASESDRKDITILGRKISAHYMKKADKVPVIPVSAGKINISQPTFVLSHDVWHVFSGNNRVAPVVSSNNLIYAIAFIVWNDLFMENTVRMQPNASNITLQEIINLGRRLSNFIGVYKRLDLKLSDYLKKEHITRMLVVLGLEKTPWYEKKADYRVVYANCWGEIFAKSFDTAEKFEAFLTDAGKGSNRIETSYYVRRNTASFEKIIFRSKRLLLGENRG